MSKCEYGVLYSHLFVFDGECVGFGEVDGFDELVEGGVDAGWFGGLDVAGEYVDGLGEGLQGLAGGGFSGGGGL